MPCHDGDGRRTEIGPAHKAIGRALSPFDERARVRLLCRPDDIIAVEFFCEQGNAAEDLLLTSASARSSTSLTRASASAFEARGTHV